MYSEVYALDHKSPIDGSTTTTHYMKGATIVDNLNWLNNLGSDLLIQRGMPIHEHNSRALSSLEAKKELMMAKALSSSSIKDKKKVAKSAPANLITYDEAEDTIKVFSQIYFGKQMWKLSIQQIDLQILKPQFVLTSNNQTSIQYYAFFAYLLLKGDILPKFKQFTKLYFDSPSVILDDTNLTQKVTSMLSCLQKFNIDSKSKLIDMWRNTNPFFLRDSFILWFDPARQKATIKQLKNDWEEIT